MKLIIRSKLKRLLSILLICLITGLAVSVLGFLNYENNLVSAQANQASQAVKFLINALNATGNEYNADELVLMFDEFDGRNHIFGDISDSFFVYDKEENSIYGLSDDADSGSILTLLEKNNFKETIEDDVHYIPVS